MIERRYPIQTVLAERKMFAGGGAVLPQQMMPQQQQMMPPQQSGGILASSGPLLDAVAAGAINPDGDGGASLSDVQGFANGGLSTSQDLPYITRSLFEKQIGGLSARPDSRFLPESGVTTDFSAQLTGATDEQLRQFISSVDPITQGYVLSQAQTELDRRSSLVSLNTQPVNSLTPLTPSPLFQPDGDESVGEDPPDFADAVTEGPDANMASLDISTNPNFTGYMDEESTDPSDGGPSDGGAGDQGDDTDGVGEGPDGSEGPPAADGGYFTSRMYNANAGQSGYPNMTAAEEIENGVQRFQDGGLNRYQTNPDGTYTQIVPEQIAQPKSAAEQISAIQAVTGEPDPAAGLINDYRKNPDGTVTLVGADTGESTTQTGSPLGSILRNAMVGNRSALAAKAFPNVLPDRSPEGGIGFGYDRSLLESEDTLNEEYLDDGAPVDTPVSAEAEVDGELVGGSRTVEGAPVVSSSESEVENEINRIQQSVVKKAVVGLTEASNKEDTKTGMTDFINDFKSAMPEYEGMSESEKGYAIMEAGLRIMAGKSSDALTNIAEGLKGLGPKFAKDAKDKRAWNRQIDLSAAKYALSSVEKLRTEEKALAAEGRKRPFEMVTTEAVEIDGVLVPRGTAVPLTNQQITDGYIGKFKLTYRESFISDAKAAAKLAELANKGLIKPNLFSADRKTYLENSRSVKNGLRMKGLLMEAAKIAIPEGAEDSKILGAIPLFKSWVDKGFNAAGYQNTAEINQFRNDDPEQYRTLMKTIGTTMVTEILNESNKTISEGDRARVDDLVAAYSDFDGTVASYRSLLLKLNNLEKTIDSGIEGASKSMRGIEENWGKAEFFGGGTAAKTMASIRNFSGSPASYSVGDRSSKPIPYKDIINMKTRKFTPKYQNIFGKKVPK
jgi:hypothetical protein